jgi:hypothetical protein
MRLMSVSRLWVGEITAWKEELRTKRCLLADSCCIQMIFRPSPGKECRLSIISKAAIISSYCSAPWRAAFFNWYPR